MADRIHCGPCGLCVKLMGVGGATNRAVSRALILAVVCLTSCDRMPPGCADPPPPGETLLTTPGDSAFTAVAPDTFIVRYATSAGDFFIQVNREWAPLGADRFYNLVRSGFYDGTRFYRVVDYFVVQWGINGDTAVTRAWSRMCIPDDPVRQINTLRRVTFAFGQPGTRTTQLFINLAMNSSLDSRGFAPIGEVISGMEVVDSLYSEYGEMAPRGDGPDPSRIIREGNDYLRREFPQLDSVISARVVAHR